MAAEVARTEDPLYLTEAETVELINQAGIESVLPLRFGPGWVALDAPPDHWAAIHIRNFRIEQQWKPA